MTFSIIRHLIAEENGHARAWPFFSVSILLFTLHTLYVEINSASILFYWLALYKSTAAVISLLRLRTSPHRYYMNFNSKSQHQNEPKFRKMHIGAQSAGYRQNCRCVQNWTVRNPHYQCQPTKRTKPAPAKVLAFAILWDCRPWRVLSRRYIPEHSHEWPRLRFCQC